MTDIRANRFVGEQNVWEVRTSDPSTTEEGEMWLRSDLAPDTNQLATLRFDDGASILDIPIYATGSSGSSVSEALRVETPSGTGFIPTLPETDATFPQLRFQHNGGVTAFHDVPELASAFFDVQNLTTNSPVTEGSNLNANFDLENTGSQDGTQTVELLDFSGTVVDSSSETVTAGTLETGKQLTWATASGNAGTGDITVQSDNDLATAAVEIQSSSAIPDSDLARFDATQLSLTDGDTVSTWPDQSGQGNDLSGLNGPTYDGGGINGNPAVNLDGVDDYLESGAFSSVKSQPVTVFIVADATDNGGKQVPIDGDSQFFFVNYQFSDSRFNQRVSSNNIGGTPPSTPAIVTSVFDENNSLLRENGSDEFSGNVGTGDLDGILVGRQNSGSNYFDGPIGEIIYYNYRLSSSEIADVESYLSDKWGIAI